VANEQAVKFGISNAYYAVYDESTGKYGTPKRLKGAVSMSISREGDESRFYADNIVYYQMSTNAGYSGDFELALTPDSVYTDLLGQETDANGVLVESSDDKQATFALMYEVSGNAFDQRFVMYNCTLSRPATDAKTKEDTTTPDTDTLNISMVSREFPWGTGVKNIVKASVKNEEATKTQYDNWYTEVYVPTKASA
jgi:phi13 family phage major tail protein